MSEENVEVARHSLDAFADRNLDALRDDFSQDAVMYAPEGWPEGGLFDGREAIMRQMLRLQEDWQTQNMTVPRIDSRDEWVVVEFRWDATGAGSGLSVEMSLTGAWRIDAGKIVELRFFRNWDKALEAAGLRE
jgi:ketosteroid isomerase-like protein